MPREIHILWTDDEIDLLRPYILFLEEKGYRISTAANGNDALRMVEESDFDLIFLDENMPGLSGLQTLEQIKNISPTVPVIMITKSEEEDIMDEAIGSKIADYLIKPVNPNQILLAIKKNIDTRRLVTQKTTSSYQTQFGQIGQQINMASGFDDWTELYRKLVFWELQLEGSDDEGMKDILRHQKAEANLSFARFIRNNYPGWFTLSESSRPLLSPALLKQKLFPLLNGEKVFFLLIDNLRYDQWKVLEDELSGFFRVEEETVYCSILPTATQYARNAMFAGLMPGEIATRFPNYWVDEDDERTKNQFEEELLREQMNRSGLRNSLMYEKVNNQRAGKKLVDEFRDLLNYDLVVLVYNFVDMLSHARTEMDMIRELAYDETSYRSLTRSWFRNSYFKDLLRLLAAEKVKVVITTDHGATRVSNPVKVIGDRKTSTNLRYKQGKNMNYNPREVMEITRPATIHLPKQNVSTSYIFANPDDFLVYPNNYNQFVNYYRNTFQHGGISMEEMLIPYIILSPNA